MPKSAASLAAIALMLAAGLSACSPGDAELEGDLNIVGMEPAFWSVVVSRTDKTTTISSTGNSDLTAELPVKTRGPDGATILTSKTADGDFVMSLRQEKCSDGMSDREYAWSVSAAWKGETLKGCAGAPKV